MSVFTITYWGATGSISAPLRPAQVTAKVVDTLEHLINAGRLTGLTSGAGLRARLQQEIEALPRHLHSTYGGNTTCVEIATPDRLIILDCGSGFRELGCALQHRWNAPDFQGQRSADVLVTHPHVDHTFATPFFSPYYDSRNTFAIWGTKSVLDSLDAVFSPTSSLSQTFFPPTFDLMKAINKLCELTAGQELTLGSTQIKTRALRHPGGCLAYRLENADRVYVFATDHEQTTSPDPTLTEFAQGADVLYTEGQYTLAEYEGREAVPGETAMSRRGWGHSAIERCVETAIAAGVRHLHLGHRDPVRSDADIARLEHYARELAAGRVEVTIPYEGMVVCL